MLNNEIIRAVIIEDEPKNTVLLKRLIDKYCPQIKVCGEANSIESSVKLLQQRNPDIVFLDIEIIGGNAFQLLDILQPVKFSVIFITAYDNYLLKAIKYSALDYLFKPINIHELIIAVNKSIDKIHTQKTSEKIDLLLQNISTQKSPATIVLPTASGSQFITIHNIVRCEAKGSYTVIFLNDKKSYTASKTLGEFEALLPANIFFRTHHSHLVNLDFILKYHSGKRAFIEMADKSIIPLAIRRKGEFINFFSSK